MFTNRRKTFIVFLIAFVVLIGSGTLLVATGKAEDIWFQLAPKSKLKKFYESEHQNFFDTIPEELAQKHQKTIRKIDEYIIANHVSGAILSTSSDFSLNYYVEIIQIGVFPYIHNEQFAADIRAFVDDASNIILRKEDFLKEQQRLDRTQGFTSVVPLVLNGATTAPSLHDNGYNRTGAVDYAHKWTQNGKELRNQNYSYFNGYNDCTNFVSQVLHDSGAGKLSYVRIDHWGWDYDDADNWYYVNGYLDPPSWTWGGANNLFTHLRYYSSNIRNVQYTSDLQTGDVVLWDKTPNDGVVNIGHSSVVTKIQNGQVYLTYHSTDKEDEPITTFFNAGYIGYAWAINH